jgi:hypothetical protein
MRDEARDLRVCVELERERKAKEIWFADIQSAGEKRTDGAAV